MRGRGSALLWRCAALWLLLIGCAAPREVGLPSAVAEWRIKGSAVCYTSVPDHLKILPGVEKAQQTCSAEYAGDPEMTLSVYVMPDEESAFALVQNWKQPSSGKTAFYRGGLFVMVESPLADLKTLGRFGAAVGAQLRLKN